MKLALLVIMSAAFAFVSASPAHLATEVTDIPEEHGTDLHACDPCKAKYFECMEKICWHTPNNRKAWEYCHKSCSCKAYKAAAICTGCKWRCH